MPTPIHSNKPSFSGGEFSPSLYARVDIQKYSTGARKLRNFFVHPYGGISNRPGLHYIAAAKYNNKKTRVQDFQFSSNQNYVLEFGDYYIRFYTNDAQLNKSAGSAWVTGHAYTLNDLTYASSNVYRAIQNHTSGTLSADITAERWTVDTAAWVATTAYVIGNYAGVSSGTASPTIYYCTQGHTSSTSFTVDLAATLSGTALWNAQTIYEVPSPYAESDLSTLRFAQSADVLFIVSPDYQTRELTRYYDTTWQLSLYDFQNGPFRLANTDSTLTMRTSATSGVATLTASASFFFPTHASSVMQINHTIDGQTMSQSITAATITTSIMCGGTWRIITHGTWTGKFQVQKSTDGTAWSTLRQFTSANDYNVDTYGTEDMSDGALPFSVRAQAITLGSGTLNLDLTSDPYIQQGVVKLGAYISPTAMTVTFQRPTGSTVTTTNWAEGAWSDYRGWPKTVVFAQDRLVFGGTLYDPQTLWMTQTGNYYDFMRNDPLVASDGITLNLPSQRLNEINGLTSLLQLLVFTTGGEWSVGSTSNNIFSPTSMQTRLNGYTGSNGIQPAVIVNRAIYIQSRGAVVRDMGYDLFTDTFTGSNLSLMSTHLFFHYNIIEMAYQQDPDSLIWAIRDDGILLSMTYMREQEVLAWTWHDTNNGTDVFESVCSIPSIDS
jgi:hypothetical protein